MNKFLEHTKKAASKARQASISNLNAASTVLSNASGTSIKLTTAKTDEEIMRLLEEEPILFAGPVWKRRGGLGKLASYTNAWESRHLQLRGTVLLYFDSDPTKASSSSNDPQELLRGYLDLAEEKASVQATFGHSGAPSPFCLSIKVPVGLAQETKWKLCFEHHQTQMEWLSAISDVVIQCSVDVYNRALLDATNPKGAMDTSVHTRRPPVYEPGTKELHSPGKSKKTRSGSFQLVDSPHQLWMMDDYSVERKTTMTEEQKAKTKASVDTALQVMERLLAEERNQRAIAVQKVEALEIELEAARQARDLSEKERIAVTAKIKSLEEELAIRISTYDLGDGLDEAYQEETFVLRERVHKLTQELASKKQELEEAKKDEYANELDEQLSALQTEIVIARSEFEQALEIMQQKVVEKENELESVRNSMGERIEQLEEEMEKAKKEYQEAIQALAATFQQRVKDTEKIETNTASVVTGNGGDTASITRSPSFSSDNDDEFKDCVDS